MYILVIVRMFLVHVYIYDRHCIGLYTVLLFTEYTADVLYTEPCRLRSGTVNKRGPSSIPVSRINLSTKALNSFTSFSLQFRLLYIP